MKPGLAVAAVWLFAARDASAEPCRVRIALAPAEVRAEIEAWVKAEPRCERELEVRVVPTEDGRLYLQAVDGTGRVRERVVPDAQSAAVLVVSWMADDSLGSDFETQRELRIDPSPLPPAAVVDITVPELRGAVAREPGGDAPRRWLLLGKMGGRQGEGVRAQVDVLAGKGWSLGVAGGWLEGYRGDDKGHARVVLGARTSVSPRMSLRAQLGVGVEVGRRFGRDEDGDRMRGDDYASPSLELGAFVDTRLADRWGLVVGPIASASAARGAFGGFVGIQRGL
jgi:hypothetical protein